MLDPLTALGLAGNLIQVIQFSYDIVSEGNKIYHNASGVLTQNKAVEEVSSDLAKLTETLRTKQDEWRLAHGQDALDPDETCLRNLCDRCVDVVSELQIQLGKLKVKEGRGKRLRSYKQALIAVWRKDEVEELEQRLERYQKELDTRVLFGIRQSLQAADVRSSEQFATLDQKTQDLTNAVLNYHGTFDTRLDHHTDILDQIAAGQVKTHQLLQLVMSTARAPSPVPPPTYTQATVAGASEAPDRKATPLHEAAADGITIKVRQLLRNTAIDVNARDQQGCTPLHLAEHAEIVRYLLKDKRTELDPEDAVGRTPLHYAILKRRLDVVKVLLENDVDQISHDDTGKTAKFYAQTCPAASWMLRYGTEVEAKSTDHLNNTGLLHLAWLGDLEGTEFYLAQGAFVDARNDNGETALTESARHGDIQVVELLLKHGANTEIAAGDEWTPLLQAIRDGREAVVRLLLQHKALKRAKLASGNHTVAEACSRKHFGIARLLIEAGSHVDSRDIEKATPLFKASYEGDLEFVRWALQQGANPNSINDASLTPLYVACERGHSEVATLLLKAGASHQMRVPQTNWTPLTIAATRGWNKCVKALLHHGADPNIQGHFQHTPMAEACYRGHSQMLKLFIAAKADLEATNSSGFTLLGVAAHKGQDECVRVLIEAGVNLEARGFAHKKPERYVTPLMRAARWNRPSTIALLKQHGAHIEARDLGGKTALMLAVCYQQIDSVRTLIACGANVNAADELGQTALHHAARLGNEAIVRLLVDARANTDMRDACGRTAWITAVHHHKEDLLRELLEPDSAKEEYMRDVQRTKHPSDIAKHLNMLYQ